MKRLERLVFPRSQWVNFLIIACLSGAISFLLIGRQAYQANWGLIDDHEIFRFLGPSLHLPLSEVWSTLLAKTEVGTLQGRFRPGYYTFKLIETSLWGANVHLWYLVRTIGFAIFLSSIWWSMRRFAGIWLSGVLTAYISLLPLWADVWSRLGPSEIYGAVCIGIMVFAAYFIFFSDNYRTRNVSGIALTLATIALIGMKETFIPIAGGTGAVFLLAGVRKKLSLLVITILMLLVTASLAGIVVIVRKQVLVSGADFYAKTIELWPVLQFAGKGFLSAIVRTSWLFVIPILLFGVLHLIPSKPLGNWITDSSVALGAYGFLVGTYAVQCALYRSAFPLHLRYDFPAMLLVPLTGCVLACYVFYTSRPFFSERATNYAQLATAVVIVFCFALGSAWLDSGRALSAAIQSNIETTNRFYHELSLALRAAEKSPESPIILEAYGPGAYEAVFSLSIYLPTMGARNPISVRLHPDEKVKTNGELFDGLQRTLADLEEAGTDALTPLQNILASHPQSCISIGINGSPEAGCAGFQVQSP